MQMPMANPSASNRSIGMIPSLQSRRGPDKSPPVLLLPRLYPRQAEIIRHPAKLKFLAMGRRWGKSTMAGVLTLNTAIHGGAAAWIAPTYKNSRPLWAMVERFLAPVAHLCQVRRSEREVVFPGGGRVNIFSGDSADAMRGYAFDLVIEDEAARIPESAHYDVILPTLADRDGRLMAISTPKGKNWFFREWTKARNGEKGAASFTAPSSDNPSPMIQRAAAMAKETMSEKTYRQEWLAEFVDDGGLLFNHVRRAATAPPLAGPPPDSYLVAGIDWAGTGEDFTVITILDATHKREVHKVRWNGLDWEMSVARAEGVLKRWGVQVALGEDNGMGGHMNARLRRNGIRVRDFHTSHTSKAEIIESLVLAFEKGDLAILADDETLIQLEAFESTRLPSGEFRYAAPDGIHDDDVMSMAIAWKAANGRAFSFA